MNVGERDRTATGDLGRIAASRDRAGLRRARVVESQAAPPAGAAPVRRACARPGARGSGRPAAGPVSARSHGSPTWSGSRRSDANRSSATGQAASSAPRRWASSTRESTTAPSPRRARIRPSASGPSRSRRSPRIDAGCRTGRSTARVRARSGGDGRRRSSRPPPRAGRPVDEGRLREPRRRPEPALLDEGPHPAGRASLQRGERARRRAPGDRKLRPTVGDHGLNGGQRAGRGVRQPRPAAPVRRARRRPASPGRIARRVRRRRSATG